MTRGGSVLEAEQGHSGNNEVNAVCPTVCFSVPDSL